VGVDVQRGGEIVGEGGFADAQVLADGEDHRVGQGGGELDAFPDGVAAPEAEHFQQHTPAALVAKLEIGDQDTGAGQVDQIGGGADAPAGVQLRQRGP
jgi:hypothetical protein